MCHKLVLNCSIFVVRLSLLSLVVILGFLVFSRINSRYPVDYLTCFTL